jgi:hypothetical protein
LYVIDKDVYSGASDADDPLFPVLRRHLNALLAASRMWVQRRDLDERTVKRLRRQAILLNHRRYLARIPVYRHLAKERGIDAAADVQKVATELMFSSDVFKSYGSRWLSVANFDAMTEWLGRLFIRRLAISMEGIADIAAWRRRLRSEGVFVTCSSGTGGQFSFVPRDRFTLAALIENGQWYSHTIMDDAPGAPFDCLILGPRGTSMGIQAAGTGLARTARRAHFLFNAELTPDMLTALQGSPSETATSTALSTFLDMSGPGRDSVFANAFAFLRQASADHTRVLVFGPPFLVHEMCTRLVQDYRPVCLEPGSTVVTAGGWKTVTPVTADELQRDIERALCVPPGRQVDTYSTSECNCVLIRCRHGRYHAPPVLELVALDDLLLPREGNDVLGTIGFLDPFAASYPGFLVTGDRGRLVDGVCACGLTGWSVVGAFERAPGYVAKSCAGALASVLG